MQPLRNGPKRSGATVRVAVRRLSNILASVGAPTPHGTLLPMLRKEPRDALVNPATPAARLRRLRIWWVQTTHRRIVTKHAWEAVQRLDGTVLDAGGGRSAPHDGAWSAGAKRIRLDVVADHRPEVVGDATRMPFREGSFDAAVAFELLEHLSNPVAFASECYRVLRPGGVFYGTAPFIYPIHGDPHDYLRYTADGLRTVFAAFDVIDVQPYGSHWSSTWTLLTTQSRAVRLLLPALRRWPWRVNPRCPEGYVITARKNPGR